MNPDAHLTSVHWKPVLRQARLSLPIALMASAICACMGATPTHDNTTINTSITAGTTVTNVSCAVPASPIIRVESFGAVGDGVADDTNALLNAIHSMPSTGGTLQFGAGRTYKVSGTLPFTGMTGFGIVGNGATIFVANGTPTTNNRVLAFTRSSGFTVINLTIDGNRANRTPQESYGGMNITIQGGSDWTFCNVHSNNSTTDGFYIEPVDNTNPSTYPIHGVLQDCTADNSFRQGLSLINGIDIRILGGAYTHSNGTLPAAGIDLEPNSGSASPGIQDVLIRGVRFENNQGSGVDAGGPVTIERVTVEDSTFVNNSTNTFGGQSRGAGLYLGSCAHSLAQNNTFTRHGSNVYRGILELPAQPLETGDVIRGNTFVDNTSTNPVVYVHSVSGPNNYIVDNTFLRNGGTSIANYNPRSPSNPTGTCTSGNNTGGTLDAPSSACDPVPTAGYAPP